ncbi:basic proline-rich protein-like [Bubalus bubalis]|uniref:basic proline-rich protein-like n=1 Tax=Bubalus bubalis TaxID=89462 RepID=UPI001D0F9AF5|nr:basic proline-rich protein-like [Bubalus bubalis]
MGKGGSLAGGCHAPWGASWRPPRIPTPGGAPWGRSQAEARAAGSSGAECGRRSFRGKGTARRAAGRGLREEAAPDRVRPCCAGLRGAAAASASCSAALPLARSAASPGRTPDLHAPAPGVARRLPGPPPPRRGFGLSPGLASKRGDPPSPASLRTSIPGRVTPTLPTDFPRRSPCCPHHHRPDPTFSPAYPTFAPSASPSPSPCLPHRAPVLTAPILPPPSPRSHAPLRCLLATPPRLCRSPLLQQAPLSSSIKPVPLPFALGSPRARPACRPQPGPPRPLRQAPSPPITAPPAPLLRRFPPPLGAAAPTAPAPAPRCARSAAASPDRAGCGSARAALCPWPAAAEARALGLCPAARAAAPGRRGPGRAGGTDPSRLAPGCRRRHPWVFRVPAGDGGLAAAAGRPGDAGRWPEWWRGLGPAVRCSEGARGAGRGRLRGLLPR